MIVRDGGDEMSGGKWVEGLTPEMPVVDAARAVLAARFELVREYLPLAATKPYEDSEHVHQLRVGTRRAGAALKAFASCLPKKRLAAAKRQLRAIRRAAGGARDWDVFIEGLPTARPLANATGKPALDFLLGYALAERSAAQTRLSEAAAEVGTKFLEESPGILDHLREPEGHVLRTLSDLAGSHLTGLIVAFSEDLAQEEGPEEEAGARLHHLRIRAKQLRYAMEIFAGCFAAPLRDTLYPATEAIQESLGGWHDANVGIERLEKLQEQARAVAPEEWARQRPGVTGLIRSLRSKRTSAREKFVPVRNAWTQATAEHPIEGLLLTAQPV